MELNRCYLGDAASVLRTFEDESVHCCVTSPPYFSLRDYNVPGQIGQEEDASEYIARLVDVFSEVYRVLRKDGTCWIVIGDSYAGRCGVISKGRCGFGDRKNLHTVRKGAKEKDLLGIPWMLAFALRDAGWYLRQDIIWAKANPMPAPMKDRCISSHEHIPVAEQESQVLFRLQGHHGRGRHPGGLESRDSLRRIQVRRFYRGWWYLFRKSVGSEGGGRPVRPEQEGRVDGRNVFQQGSAFCHISAETHRAVCACWVSGGRNCARLLHGERNYGHCGTEFASEFRRN